MSSKLLKIAHHLSTKAHTTRTVITATQWANRCRKINVLDSQMSYYDSGTPMKNTVVFLHGNPTSSYLWRNIIPHVETRARCLAPDLVGMGWSGKCADNSYRFVDHFKYLSEWFNIVDLPDKVVIVCHDWGSALGFHWTSLNSARVKGVVHMESLVAPVSSWEKWPEIARSFFQALRSEAGEEMVLKKNLFVERLLPLSMIRELAPEEMDAYLAPYQSGGECRRPTLTWPREIPVIGDGPDDVINIAIKYREFFRNKRGMPKLFIKADPGFFSKDIENEALSWPDTTTATVKGLHFLQEDSPDEIGSAIAHFLDDLEQLMPKHHL